MKANTCRPLVLIIPDGWGYRDSAEGYAIESGWYADIALFAQGLTVISTFRVGS